MGLENCRSFFRRRFTSVGGERWSFDEWCADHGKSYSSAEEWVERQAVYLRNGALVERLNEQHRLA